MTNFPPRRPSSTAPESGTGGEIPWPSAVDATPGMSGNVSLAVGRTLGTVVVTVDGDLDLAGCQLLEVVLTDLIEGQGNLTVAVDLGGAIVEPEALMVFITAARRARRHGAKFILKEPPADTHEALASGELHELVEILPRAAAG